MKRILACAAGLVLASASPVFAQSVANERRVQFGIEGGLALATLSSYETGAVDESFDTGVRQGRSIGGFVDLRLCDGLWLRPGLSFVQKGAVIRFGGSGGADSATVALHYVEAAVLLTLAPSGGATRLFLNAGPTLGARTSASVDASASGGSSHVDIGSQVRTADVGIALGAGLTHHRWSVEARFGQGVIDIGNTRQVSDVIRTRTLAILAAIRF